MNYLAITSVSNEYNSINQLKCEKEERNPETLEFTMEIKRVTLTGHVSYIPKWASPGSVQKSVFILASEQNIAQRT